MSRDFELEYERLFKWRDLWTRLASRRNRERPRLQTTQEAIERRARIANRKIGELLRERDQAEQSPVEVEDEAPLAGWAKPSSSPQFHYFIEWAGELLLRSACSVYFTTCHFYDRDLPLDRDRQNHAPGNCMGCRAWLAIPKNRQQLEAQR